MNHVRYGDRVIAELDGPPLDPATRERLSAEIAKRMESDFARILLGDQPPPKPTALVANSFGGYDVRELDENGKPIIPKPARAGIVNMEPIP